jgi:hypothetical protein
VIHMYQLIFWRISRTKFTLLVAREKNLKIPKRGNQKLQKQRTDNAQYLMVSMLSRSVEDRGLDTRSGQTKVKDYKIDKIGICCFSAKHATLIWGERSRTKTGWLRNRIMYLRGATCLDADYCFCELAL